MSRDTASLSFFTDYTYIEEKKKKERLKELKGDPLQQNHIAQIAAMPYSLRNVTGLFPGEECLFQISCLIFSCFVIFFLKKFKTIYPFIKNLYTHFKNLLYQLEL